MTEDTATALIGLTVSAIVATTIVGTVTLLYLGRWVSWMVRR